MNELSRISVVLPSLDPDEKLVAVVDGLLEYGFTDIILVNDGSKSENLHYFTDLFCCSICVFPIYIFPITDTTSQLGPKQLS